MLCRFVDLCAWGTGEFGIKIGLVQAGDVEEALVVKVGLLGLECSLDLFAGIKPSLAGPSVIVSGWELD